MESPFEIMLIGFGVLGISFGELFLLGATQLEPQLFGYIARYLFLDSEDVGQPAAVLLAPKMRSIIRVGQLRFDDEQVAARKQSTRHHRAHPEVATDDL